MKKLLLTSLASFFLLIVFGQTEDVQATIKNGSALNSVMVVLKSKVTYTESISNLQFTVQIPKTVTPKPTASILSNPLDAFAPTSSYTTQVVDDEGGFYTYLFNAVPTGASALTLTSGVEVNALEIQFTGGPVVTSDVRLAHVASGGSTSQLALYIELGGTDRTNYSELFYGTGATNGGSYDAYSFVPISNVVLPMNLIKFNAVKINDNGWLDWTVTNQTSNNKRFDIERSTDGRRFIKIGSTDVRFNGNSTESYQFTDKNLSTVLSNGTLYYRIKQVDIYNKYGYSQIRNINLTEQRPASIFPNPAATSSTLNFDLASAQKVSITVRDNNGKVISRFQQDAAKGINQAKINVNNLAKGKYNVTVTDSENNIQTLPLIKL